MKRNTETVEPIYRLMTKKDLDSYFELLEICFKESKEFQRIEKNEMKKTLKNTFNPLIRFLFKLFGVKIIHYITEVDDQIIGATTLSAVRKRGLISAVMTHPDYRRRGIARKLFTMASQKARALKKDFLWLDVDAHNTGAIKLYESEGFNWYYHCGIFEFTPSSSITRENGGGVFLKEISKADQEHLDQLLDDCFSKEYFEFKAREKERKRFNLSKRKKRLLKFFGIKTNCYGIFVPGEEQPKGYLRATQDKFTKGIEFRSPIILERDSHLVSEVIPLLVDLLLGEEIKKIIFSFSMHRKELIKHLEKVGLTKTHEMLEMIKKIA